MTDFIDRFLIARLIGIEYIRWRRTFSIRLRSWLDYCARAVYYLTVFTKTSIVFKSIVPDWVPKGFVARLSSRTALPTRILLTRICSNCVLHTQLTADFSLEIQKQNPRDKR